MKSRSRSIRTLFLLQRPEAWVNFASVWAAMVESEEFEPTIWLLPSNYSKPALSAPRKIEAKVLLRSQGIPFVEWHDGMRLESGVWDVVVFGHPYDRERAPQLCFSRIAEKVPHSIYIPYGLSMGGGKKNLYLQYAQPTQINSSVVVARSAIEKAQYSRHCPTGDGHVQVLGHPRFDVLLKDLEKAVPDKLARFCRNRTVFLWSSHFSFGRRYSQSSNFSTFDLIGPELFEYALIHRQDFCLLWRPHPALIPGLVQDGILSERELVLLRAELHDNGIYLDEGPGYAASFRASDGLISDTGSFIIEYLATGKPILALTNPEGEPLNDEAEALVSHLSRAACLEEIEGFMNAVRGGTVDQDLAEARLVFLPLLDGAAGKRVTNAAKALVMQHADSSDPIDNQEFFCRALPSPHVAQRVNSPVKWRNSSVPTPTLNKLCESLREVRLAKSRELRVLKWMRRKLNNVRAWGVESLKRQELFPRS